MKILSLIALLFSFNSFATDPCFKDLCINHVVRDQFGWKGTVVDFDRDNEQVMVSLSHVPSVWPFPYADLGRMVRCYKEICEGQMVTDPYGDKVKVIEIYNHGLVYIWDDNIDGNLLYRFEEIKP